MKTTLKMIIGCMLFTSLPMTSFGQAPMTSIEEGGKKPAQTDKAKVPAVVTTAYVVDYPVVTSETWYAYRDLNGDWYAYNPYLVVEEGVEPEYYVVEVISEKEPYKTMYSKEGKKIATSRKLKSELPKPVLNALNKSAYKNWTVKKEKEEILKHSDNTKVYKVVVENGKEKHCLFFQPDGTLLKDKDDRKDSNIGQK